MLLLDRTQAPAAHDIEHFSLLPAQRALLPNGVPLVYLNGGAQPVLNLQIIFEAGKVYETQLGQSGFVARMLGEGTKSYSSAQISAIFDAYGAFWSANTGTDWIGIDVYCLSKHLEAILPVVTELVAEAVFPEEELATAKSMMQQQLAINLEKTSYMATSAFKEALYGETHPYGYTADAAAIDALNVVILEEFYRNNFHTGRMRVYLSGQFDDGHLRALERTIGALAASDKATPAIESIDLAVLPPVKRYWEKPDAVQSSLRIGRRFINRTHPDQLPFQVFNTLLGGYFGSRLMQNIREEKGLSYGIYSSISYMKHDGFFFISSDVQRAQKDLALEEIYKEIQQLCTEPVSQEELDLVKNYMAGSLVKSIESPMSIIGYHKTLDIYKLPHDYYDTYIPQIRQITAEQVMEMGQRYLLEGLSEIVAG